MHQTGVFYHVTRSPWQNGQPLLCWNRLVAAGIRSAADWQHPKVEVGFDGDVIALHQMLSEARYWAHHNGLDETGIVVRVRVPDPSLADIRSNSEQYYCYPDEIPAAWLEVVGPDEKDWSPSGR